MPNVLLLCEYATLSGGEHSMLGTFEGLLAAGFTPSVAAPPSGPLVEALRAAGVEHVPFPLQTADGKRLSQQLRREELAELLRQRRPDLLHANSLSMGRLCGPVAKDSRLPSITHLRDIVRLSGRAIADLNCNRRLLAVSRATRDFHAGAGLAAEKTHVLYNGVDLQQFRPRAATGFLHRERDIPPGTPLIGTIGQICLRKGQDVLLRAAAMAAGRLPDANYLVVGERYSDKDESRRFESDLHTTDSGPLAGKLHFLGFRHDVGKILSELTLLVHPARQEPLGRVLLEAAAAGTAVIATDVGGTREIFPRQSQSARFVSPDDPEAMAGAIVELLSDARLRSKLSASARRRAEDAFELQQATGKLAEHYRQVASSQDQ